MVSEKVVVALLVLTIILSVISIAVAFSANTNIVPKTKPSTGNTVDTSTGEISLIIEPPATENGIK